MGAARHLKEIWVNGYTHTHVHEPTVVVIVPQLGLPNNVAAAAVVAMYELTCQGKRTRLLRSDVEHLYVVWLSIKSPGICMRHQSLLLPRTFAVEKVFPTASGWSENAADRNDLQQKQRSNP